MSRAVLHLVTAGSALLCLYSLHDFIQAGGSPGDRSIRAVAPFSSPLVLNAYVVLVIPFLIYNVIAQSTPVLRCIPIASVLLALAAQYASHTRAGWVAFILQGLAFSLHRRSRILPAVLLIALSLLSVLIYRIHPEAILDRLAAWRLGLETIFANPLLGVGYGNQTFFLLFQDNIVTRATPSLHNTFAMVAFGSGFLALVGLLWTMIRGFNVLTASEQCPPYGMCAALMILGYMTCNFFDYIFSGSPSKLFWMLLAFGIHACTPLASERKPSVP